MEAKGTTLQVLVLSFCYCMSGGKLLNLCEQAHNWSAPYLPLNVIRKVCQEDGCLRASALRQGEVHSNHSDLWMMIDYLTVGLDEGSGS